MSVNPIPESELHQEILRLQEQLQLVKAEVEDKNRELEIESSLERVRVVAMQMQKPDDMLEVCRVISDELEALPITNMRDVQTAVINLETGVYLNYEYFTQYRQTDFLILNLQHPRVAEFAQAVLTADDAFYTTSFSGDELTDWKAHRLRTNQLPDPLLDFVSSLHYYFFSIGSGAMGISSYGPLKEEEVALFRRYRNVFALAYRRFLDIEQAQEQAREATIETALERVRARAMAMHNSEDLSSTVNMVFVELRKLGIHPIRSGVGLYNTENRNVQLYATTPSGEDDSLSLIGWAVMDGHPVLKAQYDNWLLQQDYFPVLEGELLTSYYQQLTVNYALPAMPSTSKQYGYFLPFSEGLLFCWSERPYTEAEVQILKRFKSIIDLTFRRYLEIQKSETNTRAAVRQASLDRVRAEIASMRTVHDLEKITPLIWNELTVLGVPFIRCGVFIMDEVYELIHTFLSTPDGQAIAAFHLPYAAPGNITHVLAHWQQHKRYIDHWDEHDFMEFAEVLVQQGALSSADQYVKTMPRGGFYLHFLPFLQGMLYVGNTDQLHEDDLTIIASLANAFSSAYARYQDFNKLEAAKQQIENTLSELKQAQAQLIQAEKMASLGELTAGIAHEIQNPLNFVNNFAEVNAELIDELRGELAMGNSQLANEIASNIKDNEDKISFHGKRADAIVKGMLQHSRASSGVKELTDINALADEYLRLAFHGLRAKDKSFNATIKTDFDESIGLINVVPQDIGRVLLNLITNAFYAVSSVAPKSPKGDLPSYEDVYQPTVIVSTKKSKSPSGDLGAEIRVTDNGPGIPAHILDKIFQPFFTTKPTGQGTGLGLSLSYDMVKAHGGELKVETQVGEGTSFIIYLPRQ